MKFTLSALVLSLATSTQLLANQNDINKVFEAFDKSIVTLDDKKVDYEHYKKLEEKVAYIERILKKNRVSKKNPVKNKRMIEIDKVILDYNKAKSGN